MASVSSSTSSTGSSATTTTSAKTPATASRASSYASTNVGSVDWSGLIEEQVNAKLARADSIQDKVDTNDAKKSAYTRAQTLLSTLEGAAQKLRAPSGTLNKTDDVFQSRSADLTATGGITASSVVAVSTSAGAELGSHTLTVDQIAKAQKVASAEQTSNTDALSLAGTITLGTASTGSAQIAVTSDMSLADIAEAIDAKTSSTGVQASLLKVSASSYQLILSAKSTGEAIQATDGGAVLTGLGVLGSDGSFADELQAEQQATFSIDGVAMTRATNDVSDAIDGVTLHLLATTASSSSGSDAAVTITVGTDLTAVESAITGFVDAYNAYRDFAETQQQTSSDGTASDDAALFGDGTLRTTNSALSRALATSAGSTSLAAIGIGYDGDNKLVVDTTTLANAINDDLDGVKSLFAYDFQSTSSDVQLLRRGSGAPSSFALSVTTDASGTLTGASVDGDASLFTVSGQRIIGKTGTAYDGYVFVFSGKSSEQTTITTSTGVAEAVYAAADAAADTSTGSFQTQIASLQKKNTDYQSQIDDIKSRAETYRASLTTRYAKIQSSISTSQSSLTYLKALLQSSSSSSS